MDPPRPPPSPAAGSSALQLTLRVGSRAIGTRVTARNGALVPEAPLSVNVRRADGGWELTGPEGTQHLGHGESVSLRHGDIEVEVAPLRQSRFARFGWGQGDVTLPVIFMTASVFLLQLGLFFRLFASEPAGAEGFEPTPEYIARLLEGQYDGQETGVIAKRAPRPQGGEAIENYYLQPGHDGPKDHLGGGRNTGDHNQDGDLEGAKERARKTTTPAPGEEVVTEPAPEDQVVAEQAAEPEDAELEDKPIAVHVDEGWGLSDWYNTEDARKDAAEIQEQLNRVQHLLRLDPDNPTGLSIRAYYEYLALDMDAARRTYERFTKLYPDDPAGWNNLALVYKREGDYKKEEELYRTALGLAPADDHALNNLAVCLGHQGRFDEALALMKQLEVLTPDDPYADLHRAKIYAAMGKEDRAYRFLQKSLAGMRKLDTLHNIEFRQDIRIDPAFETMRGEERFRSLLTRYYGDKAEGWWNLKKRR